MTKLRLCALLTLLAAFLLLAVPAQALRCGDHWFCVWSGTSYAGDFWQDQGDHSNWPCGTFCSPDVDDNEDSVSNGNNDIVYVYGSGNFDPPFMYCVENESEDGNVTDTVDNGGQSHDNVLNDMSCGSLPKP